MTTLPPENVSENFELALLAIVSLGFGEVIGSFTMGIIVDRNSLKNLCFINVVLVIT